MSNSNGCLRKLYGMLFALVLVFSSSAHAFAGQVNVTSNYVVFAWNDLGMHCLNPTYDEAVILPPYNNLFVQVVRRGATPTVVTEGVTVEYRILNNTYSYGKRDYGQFWLFMQGLFGVSLPIDKGLNLVDPDVNNGLSGTMLAKGDHFEADGIPVTPVDDAGIWNPYHIAEITVKNANGEVLARTRATVPVSDEINCGKCHGPDAFNDVLQKHDAMHGTNLVASSPVLCANCHADPALGTEAQNGAKGYLSSAMHGSHASRGAACYDCHPGNETECSRSLAHTSNDGNCTTCHGDMAFVASSITSGGRVPWIDEPACSMCHTGVAQVNTGDVLYRNAVGHGGMYCSACHGSPHAMVPSREAPDNYQSLQYQGAAKAIGSCGACHSSSRGEGTSEFLEEHGGSYPSVMSACNVCHTSVSTTNTSRWPHSFQWGTGDTSGGTEPGGNTGGTGEEPPDEPAPTVSPVSSVSLSPSSTTVRAGTTVSFTASASGGTGNYEYSFWLSGPGTEGDVNVRGYSTSRTWSWTPGGADVGTSTVTVQARNIGSTAGFEAYDTSQVTVRTAGRRRSGGDRTGDRLTRSR